MFESKMHSYTQSTSASVQQLPIMSLRQWAESMIMHDQVPDLLRVLKVIPALKDLANQCDLYSLIDITKHERMQLVKIAKINSQTFEEAQDKAERVKLQKSLRTRSQTLHDLITGKLQIMSIASLKKSPKKIDLSKMECFDKFDDYMEKLGARQDRIDAYEDIESTTIDAIELQRECFGMFAQYLENTGARRHQIQVFADMAKILHSSFAWFLHYQKYIHSSQVEHLRGMKHASEEREISNEQLREYLRGDKHEEKSKEKHEEKYKEKQEDKYGGGSERSLPRHRGSGYIS